MATVFFKGRNKGWAIFPHKPIFPSGSQQLWGVKVFSAPKAVVVLWVFVHLEGKGKQGFFV